MHSDAITSVTNMNFTDTGVTVSAKKAVNNPKKVHLVGDIQEKLDVVRVYGSSESLNYKIMRFGMMDFKLS